VATFKHFHTEKVHTATNGHGFSITSNSRPVFAATYTTRAESETARDAIEKALSNAIEITAHG
jgi:hypothetical protein